MFAKTRKHNRVGSSLLKIWWGNKSKLFSIQKSYSNLVMEYLPTTLFSMIKTANAKHYKLDINKSIGYAYKILEGLAYLEVDIK